MPTFSKLPIINSILPKIHVSDWPDSSGCLIPVLLRYASYNQIVSLGENSMIDIMDIIFRRRSIRHYTDQPVDKDILVKLLQAAMAAPNACNSHPWEFIVVTETERLDQLRSKLQFARYNAPAAIIVCGNPEIADNPTAARRYWVQDCSAAKRHETRLRDIEYSNRQRNNAKHL
jgi:hypothetical protein